MLRELSQRELRGQGDHHRLAPPQFCFIKHELKVAEHYHRGCFHLVSDWSTGLVNESNIPNVLFPQSGILCFFD